MKQSEPLVGLLFTLFLTVLWLGFLFHQNSHFAGTFSGGVLAISGTLFLLVPLFYSVVKRVTPLKRLFTKWISFSNLLTIHIYSGFIGAILVLLHTGHKFHGILAITLTAMLLILVFSGYIGRFLLGRIAKEVTEKKRLLEGLEAQYSKDINELKAYPEQDRVVGLFIGFFSRIFAPMFVGGWKSPPSFARTGDILNIANAIADVEYAISTHELIKRTFSLWLKLHIALSLFFYFLLLLHVLGEYHFGLRWFA